MTINQLTDIDYNVQTNTLRSVLKLIVKQRRKAGDYRAALETSFIGESIYEVVADGVLRHMHPQVVSEAEKKYFTPNVIPYPAKPAEKQEPVEQYSELEQNVA